jgi:hypothetical protein
MIASPGDMREARDSVEETIHDWNNGRAEREAAVLLPMRWEARAVPMSGFAGGQEVINAQLLERADILIALFGTRAGTPTPMARSGTVEEIDKALARGLPVHVYFSRMPLSSDVDTKALDEVRALERELRDRGLNGEFKDLHELKAAVRRALDYDMQRLSAEAIAGFDGGSGGLLRIVGQARSTSDAVIVITNEGDEICRGLSLKVTSSRRKATLIMGETQFDLKPEEATKLHVLGVKAGERIGLQLDWNENGQMRKSDAQVTFVGM